MVAVSSIALLGFLGLALDVGYMYHHRRIMQTAADAAALAGGAEIERGLTTGTVQSSAQTASAAHGFANGTDGVVVTVHHPPVSGSYVGDNRFVEVLIERPLPIFVMRLFGHSSMRIPARAVAGMGGDSKSCIYVLDTSMESSFYARSNSQVTAACGIQIDSSHANAMDLNSSSDITAEGIGVNGGYTTESGATVTPSPSEGTPRAGDPLPPTVLPAPTVPTFGPKPSGAGLPPGCDYFNTLIHNQVVSVDPGVYCGGIWISNSTVTFNPGVYIMVGAAGPRVSSPTSECDQGSIHIASNGRLIGDGVMFYLTETPTLQPTWGGSQGKYRPVIFSSSPYIDLSPSVTANDPYKGILFFNDRNTPSHYVGKCLPPEKAGDLYPWTHEFESSADSNMLGILYFPNHLVRFESSTNATQSAFSSMVVRAVEIQSSTNWNLGSTWTSIPGGNPIKRLTLVE